MPDKGVVWRLHSIQGLVVRGFDIFHSSMVRSGSFHPFAGNRLTIDVDDLAVLEVSILEGVPHLNDSLGVTCDVLVVV